MRNTHTEVCGTFFNMDRYDRTIVTMNRAERLHLSREAIRAERLRVATSHNFHGEHDMRRLGQLTREANRLLDGGIVRRQVDRILDCAYENACDTVVDYNGAVHYPEDERLPGDRYSKGIWHDSFVSSIESMICDYHDAFGEPLSGHTIRWFSRRGYRG